MYGETAENKEEGNTKLLGKLCARKSWQRAHGTVLCSRISRSIGNQQIQKRKKEKARELKIPMTKKKESKGHLRKDRITWAVSDQGEEKSSLYPLLELFVHVGTYTYVCRCKSRWALEWAWTKSVVKDSSSTPLHGSFCTTGKWPLLSQIAPTQTLLKSKAGTKI